MKIIFFVIDSVLLSDLFARYAENFPVKTDPRISELEKEVEILRGLLRR